MIENYRVELTAGLQYGPGKVVGWMHVCCICKLEIHLSAYHYGELGPKCFPTRAKTRGSDGAPPRSPSNVRSNCTVEGKMSQLL